MEIEEEDHIQTQADSSSVVSTVPKAKKIKKTSILKRKNQNIAIINSPIIKKIYMIGDICLLNEDSVRDPQNSKQSFIANSLYFTKITSITLNKQFFTMNVKKNQQNFLTSKYMLDRFKSFSDLQMKELADNASDFIQQCDLLQENILRHQLQIGKQNYLFQLNQMKKKRQQRFEQLMCTRYKDQKYIALYYADGLKGLGLQKVIISNQMLKQTGLRVSDLIYQYSKQKTLFFQLMGTGAYKNTFTQGCRQTADAMKYNRLKNNNKIVFTQEEQINNFYADFSTEIYRKRHNGQVEWEQKVNCPMKFCKPTPYITVFLFGQAEEKPIAIMNQKTKKVSMMSFEAEPSIQEEMKKLRISDDSMSISIKGQNEKCIK